MKKSFKDRNTSEIFRIGCCYDFGAGVKQDFNKTKENHKQSTELVNLGVMLNLRLAIE